MSKKGLELHWAVVDEQTVFTKEMIAGIDVAKRDRDKSVVVIMAGENDGWVLKHHSDIIRETNNNVRTKEEGKAD